MPGVSFADVGLQWFEDIVGTVTDWFRQELTGGFEALGGDLFATPLPAGQGVGRVVSQPPASDGLWHGLYEATVAGEMTLLALVVLLVAVQTRYFVRIFEFGRSHERRQARRSAWTGAFLIVAWYWVAVLTLYVVQGFTVALLPDVATVAEALLKLLPQAVDTPITTLLLAALGGLSVLLLEALFFVREVLLYVYLYVMPVGLALAYGHIPVVSRVARGLCAQFVPLAILPLPAALLFRGYAFLFTGATQFPLEDAFARYLVVASLPMAAVYVTWKTFTYASPLAARLIGGAGKGAVLVGAIAGAGAVAGPGAAKAAGSHGTKGAATALLAQRYAGSNSGGNAGQQQATDGGGPEYRRTEHDQPDR